jgi:ribose transport system substrate-binding protein
VRRSPFASALAAALLLSACGGAEESGQTAAGAESLTIAVVPKGTTHEFWKSVHAGAVKAARELTEAGTPIELIWKGPLREDDREQQVQVVEGFTAQGIDGLVLAPLDDRALVRPVEEAQRAGLPTVIIDSDLRSEALVSFVATDNLKGGELAADRLGQLLNGEGRVLLLRYAEGSASTTARETGFLQRMKAAFPGIEVISSDQYAGATRETAKRASENLLNRYGTDIDGIFTPNETSTDGMLLALQDIGRAGQVSFIGFDASTSLVTALRAGQLHGLVVQNPLLMGYLGVKTMVAHIKGEPVEKRIDTGVVIITPENIDSPETKELIDPPLSEYLDEG